MSNGPVITPQTRRVGFCKTPSDLCDIPILTFGAKRIVTPVEVNLTGYCTRTEDQKNDPWCAAYSAAQWAENILWRKNGAPENIDPSWIYYYAKRHDGDPDRDGTTLTAVMEALRHKGVFDPEVCKVRTVRPNKEHVKQVIHRIGCALGGFMVTPEWYEINPLNTCITGKSDEYLGGHAVMLCGYDADGVYFQNSWGTKWGDLGFAMITWEAFEKYFVYGAVLSNALDGMTA